MNENDATLADVQAVVSDVKERAVARAKREGRQIIVAFESCNKPGDVALAARAKRPA